MKALFVFFSILTAIFSFHSLYADGSEVAQMQVDCSALSADEEQFAMNLNDMNKMMFCKQFNGDQRASAMEIAGQQDANGNQMDPNMAVQKVASDNNIMPMMRQKPSGQSQPRSSSGCPVRKGN